MKYVILALKTRFCKVLQYCFCYNTTKAWIISMVPFSLPSSCYSLRMMVGQWRAVCVDVRSVWPQSEFRSGCWHAKRAESFPGELILLYSEP